MSHVRTSPGQHLVVAREKVLKWSRDIPVGRHTYESRPHDLVIKKYKRAKTNLEILYSYGAQLIHGVDAVKMKLHTDLQMRKFDRIIYNFPHAGFNGESDQQVIVMHRKLVRRFFRNASSMLRPDGEIHMTHKITSPFSFWNIEEPAGRSCLALRECVKFNIRDYPGYNNKRGDGKTPDKSFPLGKCSTFKFKLHSKAKKAAISRHRNTHQPRGISSHRPNASMVMNSSKCHRIFREYYDHALSTFGHVDDHLFRSVLHMLEIGFERCKANNRADPLNDYIYLLKEVQQSSKQRISFLRNRLLEFDHQYRL